MASAALPAIRNGHGVLVSLHHCDACGASFTVTPARDDKEWGGCCLDPTCASYDIDRDAEFLFLPDDPALIEAV